MPGKQKVILVHLSAVLTGHLGDKLSISTVAVFGNSDEYTQ